VLPLLSALSVWSASAFVMEDPISAGFFFKAMLVYLPAIWIFPGLATLLIAFKPRLASGVTWGYFAFSFFMGYFGQLFADMPEWIIKLAPFGQIPNITKDAIHWPTLVIMGGLALMMGSIGLVLYRQRDLQN
jgi:ABC-2 type transport system permease protein